MKKWFGGAGAGLFVHWGINTCNPGYDKKIPLYDSFEGFEKAACDGGWGAGKWVSAARKLRASYITFAIFHSCLGYIKAWKSCIPGTYTTKRDFLGELIGEANKYGIKIILYISGDTSGNNFFEGRQPWIFPGEYARYKNDPSIDILGDRHWQRYYCKDVIGEVIDNYPDLAGFWFDGWNNPDTNREVFGFIHAKNPNLLTMRNNFGDRPGPEEDVMSIECFGKVLDPDFDFASGAWHPPGGKEYCFVARGLSDWYQLYEPRADYDRNAAIKNFISIIANGWSAKIGLGPNVGGDFNGALGSFVDEMDRFLSWAGEAVFNTEAGGLEAGYLNGGAYAVTCHNDEACYIHVLLPPAGGVLTIADGGVDYTGAVNLKTGEGVPMIQNDGLLHIICAFDKYCAEDGDAVVKLTKGNSRVSRVLPVASYMGALPAEIIIPDAGRARSLVLHEDDTSATTRGGWAAPDNNRARDYSLSASGDGLIYTPLCAGRLSGRRGEKQINFAATGAKYLKLRVENAYDTSAGYTKKFVDGFWEYHGMGSHAPLRELTIGDRKFICDGGGRVCVWGAEGNNVYVIGTGAQGVAADADGGLLAIMPPESGRLRIKNISIIC